MTNIAFFGTPNFAIPTLQNLHDFCNSNHYNLSMVVCQPDRRSGRGQKINFPPVKELALKLNIPCHQPASLSKNSESGQNFHEIFSQANIDIAIIVAYGKIITKRLLAVPKLGFLNIHGSLLPKWRGAAPIQRAVEAGDKETGISLMQLVYEMDAGPVFCMESTPILESDTTGTLTPKLSELGADLLTANLGKILNQQIKPQEQNHNLATHAKMIDKSESNINWNRPAQELVNHIKALQPSPGVFSYLNNKRIKFGLPKIVNQNSEINNYVPGQIAQTNPTLIIQTQNGQISFEQIQPEGKKFMPISQAANSPKLEMGQVFK